MGTTLHTLKGPRGRDPQPQAHRPRSGLGHRRDSPARASRARRPAPATTARASASRAVRCRCSAASRSAASRTRSAREIFAVNVGDARRALRRRARSTSPRCSGAGMVPRRCEPVKILGEGELTKKLIVKAHAFSASAKEKIEKAGGTAEVIASKHAAAAGRVAERGNRWRPVSRTSARSRSSGGGSSSRWRCWRSTASASSSRPRASNRGDHGEDRRTRRRGRSWACSTCSRAARSSRCRSSRSASCRTSARRSSCSC